MLTKYCNGFREGIPQPYPPWKSYEYPAYPAFGTKFGCWIQSEWALQYFATFRCNFIRLGRTRAKALQTVSGFPRETPRRYAAPKSNEFAL